VLRGCGEFGGEVGESGEGDGEVDGFVGRVDVDGEDAAAGGDAHVLTGARDFDEGGVGVALELARGGSSHGHPGARLAQAVLQLLVGDELEGVGEQNAGDDEVDILSAGFLFGDVDADESGTVGGGRGAAGEEREQQNGGSEKRMASS